ncbi:hypothetical protein EPN18_03080 [bacterium]|nr:MAG: hypothetical protein EPN18_03080 [bacterium]
MKSSNSNNWAIDCQCPQCGSPAVLDETDRIFTCPYCRVRLCVTTPDFFRYVVAAPLSIKNPIYIPYWRLKGAFFSCVPFQVNHAIVDSTQVAYALKGLPFTLGLRPQVLKLSFASPEQGRFVMPGISSAEALEMIEATRERVDSAADVFSKGQVKAKSAAKPFFKTYTGEAMSVIYAPMRLEGGMLYDAVLNRPVTQAVSEEFPPPVTFGAPVFVPTLCPNCGQDLSGEKQTLVLICNNCQSAWQVDKGALSEVGYAAAPCVEEAVYLPFWKMKVRFDGIALRSYADLARTANIPRAIRTEWEDEESVFWSPAFKIAPQLFLRLSEQATFLKPPVMQSDKADMKRAYPVTLPLSEGAESVKMSLAAFAANKKEILPRLASVTTNMESALLVYLPFVKRSNDFVHPELGFGINANSLTTALNL